METIFISGMNEALRAISDFDPECLGCVSFSILAKNDYETRNVGSIKVECGDSFVFDDCEKEVCRQLVNHEREWEISMEHTTYSVDSVTLVFINSAYAYCLHWSTKSQRFEAIEQYGDGWRIRRLTTEESAELHSFKDILLLMES